MPFSISRVFRDRVPISLLNSFHRVQSLNLVFNLRLPSRSIFSSQPVQAKFKKNSLNDLLLKMPKETKHVGELQAKRQVKKQQVSKYIPGTITLQVLGSGAHGAPRSLYVFTDQSRYLFNCGEGSQRLAHEHKMKLARLEHIFITHTNWDNLGGLPGVALTIQDVGVAHIHLHGAPRILSLFESARRFIILKDLDISAVNATNDPKFEDTVMTVSYVPLWKKAACSVNQEQQSTSDSGDEIDYYANERKKCKKPKLENGDALFASGDVSIAYVCKIQPKPGTLLLEKCVEKGVPAGPLLGLLKNGEDITLPSGETVKSSDVCSPNDPGPLFIVVDCPSDEFLEALTTSPELNKYQSSFQDGMTQELEMMVHFSPAIIVQTPTYQEWLAKFPSSTKHLFLGQSSVGDYSSDTCGRGLGSEAVHRIQHKLHELHPQIFPLLGETFPDTSPSNGHYIPGETLLNYHLRPKTGLDRSAIFKLQPEQYTAESQSITGFSEALEDLRQKLKEVEPSDTREYPRVVFLGTGSCIPNKTRNTSAILVEYCPERFLMMDCGEGTYGQLARFLGSAVQRVMCNLDAIYVSHLHADHHIGLIGLLQARRKALRNAIDATAHEKLFLVAPHQITHWLSLYHRNFEPLLSDFELIPNAKIASQDKEACGMLQTRLNASVATTLVKHCPNAFGVAFNFDNGYKMVYSGDTMPCEELVTIGRDCDLLIHESTMEDGLEAEAVLKTHSTTSQAIEMGRKMNAKFTLLTHFSQRYAKVPVFSEAFGRNVGIAFDNMAVRPRDLDCLPLFLPTLKLMFAEHYEEMENKMAKRLLRTQRAQLKESKPATGVEPS